MEIAQMRRSCRVREQRSARRAEGMIGLKDEVAPAGRGNCDRMPQLLLLGTESKSTLRSSEVRVEGILAGCIY